MFNNWSLKSQLRGVFGAISIFLLVISGVGGFSLRNVANNYDHIAKINVPKLVILPNLRGSANRLEVISSINYEGDLTQRDSSKEAIKKFEDSLKKFESLEKTSAEDAGIREVKKYWENFKELHFKVLGQSASPDRKIYQIEFSKLFDSIQKLIDMQTKETEIWSQAAEYAAFTGNLVSFALSGGGFLVALFIGYLFAGYLSSRLSGLAERLMENADTVSNASSNVSNSGTKLSASTTEQAAAIQETVSAIEEVSSMVHKNAENSKRSEQVSVLSNENVLKGKQSVEAMIHSIEEIKGSNTDIMQQIEKSNQQISEIVRVISEIGNKTKVINDIVFQTKLLSFNASVEAARAGEHGKGFAVVAEEIGNLAQMSGNAAKEISEMLDESIRKVEGIVSETKSRVEGLIVTAKEKVDAGTNTAKLCDHALDEIVKNVGLVNQMISEIASASDEQARGVHEINKAMAQMDQVTQQNAQGTSEVASDAERLSNQAVSLRNLVEGLTKIIQGGFEGSPSVKKTSVKSNKKSTSIKTVSTPKNKPTIVASKPKPKVVPVVEVPAMVEEAHLVVKEMLPSHNDSRFEDV